MDAACRSTEARFLLCATDKGFLEEVLTRMKRENRDPALPDELPEWRHVDGEASVWAIRHYRKETAEQDPSSPLRDKAAANFPDQRAIGFVFWYDPKPGKVAKARYLSRAKNAVEVVAMGWHHPSEQLTPKIVEIQPGVVEISAAIDNDRVGQSFMFVPVGDILGTGSTCEKNMPSTAENVIERLDATRQKWWLFSLLTTTALAVSLSFGNLLGVHVRRRPGDAFANVAAEPMLGLAVGDHRAAAGRRTPAVARPAKPGGHGPAVEIELPELGSHAINLVQLAEDRPSVGDPFREAAVRQAAAGLESISFDRAAARELRRRRFANCMQTPRDLAEALVILALLMAAAVVCQSRIPHWTSAASRLLTPWRFVPSIGSVEILNVSPGDADVLVGENVEIAAEIKNPQDRPHQAVLLISPKTSRKPGWQ